MIVSHNPVVNGPVAGILHDPSAKDEIPYELVLVCAIAKELPLGMDRAANLGLGASHAEGLRDIPGEKPNHAVYAELGHRRIVPGVLHDVQRPCENRAWHMRGRLQ